MATEQEMFDEETERLRQLEMEQYLPAEGPAVTEEAPVVSRKFTNIPERMAEGTGWEYRPNDRYGVGEGSEFAPEGQPTREQLINDMPVITPEGIKGSGPAPFAMPESPELTAKRAEAYRVLGKERAEAPLYDAAMRNLDTQQFDPHDRRSFEKQVFKQIGGNPFELDPIAEVRKADAKLPQLFEAIFRGQATWADLPNLSKEQRAVWAQAVNAFHAQVKEAATSRQQSLYRQYKYAMENFDWMDKKNEKQEEQVRRQTLEMIKQSGKVPKFQTMMNEQGLWTVHAYDVKTGQWNDTGKVGRKSDALKSVTLDQALAVLRYIAPKDSGNPMDMVGAMLGAQAIKDPTERAAAIQRALNKKEQTVAPEYRSLWRYYMNVLYAHAGLGMEREEATPVTPASPPSNYKVYDPNANKGRGGIVPKS